MRLEEFQAGHRDLSVVVQEALAYGPDPVLNERFRTRREWVQAHYGEVRPAFDKFWTTSTDPQRFPAQNTDPFESLLASPTLEGLLSRDARQIQRDLEDIETAFDLCRESEVALN
ncbi:MAG: hypothetical protein JNM34_10885 [Chthonomonadaceae bacterium]|nr:hypothetical protein [Chthonomonadaceae bacterium]